MHVIQVEHVHGIETASKCNFTELIREIIIIINMCAEMEGCACLTQMLQ